MKNKNVESDSQNCGIYCWTNKVNGKKYIGQSVNLKYRYWAFLNFNKPYSGLYINNSRKKYPSVDFWDYTILEYCSPDELNDKEKMYIYLYNTLDEELGYNLTTGGEGYIVSEKAKEKKRRPVLQYSLDGEFIREWNSPRTAEKEIHGKWTGSINNCCLGKANSAYGYQWKYKDSDDEITEYKDRNKNITLQYSLDGEFIKEWSSVTEASEYFGSRGNSHISAVCRGEEATAFGYIWRYKDDCYLENKNMSRKRPVFQYDMNMNFIKEWVCAGSAARYYGISIKTISECCTHRKKSGAGFIWRYKDDDRPYIPKIDIRKQVCQIDKNTGEIIKIWESINYAAQQLGISNVSSISYCCKGKRKSAGGFKWRYADQPAETDPESTDK